MSNTEGTRKTACAMVISTAPDVCLTPVGSSQVPVPYPIVSYFSSATYESTSVTMTGCLVTTNATKLTVVFGDEPGVGGGVKSGVNKSIVEFTSWSQTVTCQGDFIVRHLDDAKMNDGNTIGKVAYTVPPGSPPCWIGPNGEIQFEGGCEPTVVPETEEEKGFFAGFGDQFMGRLRELKDDYGGMLGTLSDAVGLGDEAGDLEAAWSNIWDGTKALGRLGWDVASVTLVPPVLGEIVNPGASDRLKAMGEAIWTQTKEAYKTAYAEGGVGGVLGRGSVDLLHIAAQIVVEKGAGAAVSAVRGAGATDDIVRLAKMTDVAPDVRVAITEVAENSSKVPVINLADEIPGVSKHFEAPKPKPKPKPEPKPEPKPDNNTVNVKKKPKTPNQAARDAVQGEYIDPTTNKVVKTTEKLEADHIFPKKEIEGLNGYKELTIEQQEQVLNYLPNFQGLPRSFNASKGAKLADDWHSVKLGNGRAPLDPNYQKMLRDKQMRMKDELQNMINEFNKGK